MKRILALAIVPVAAVAVLATGCVTPAQAQMLSRLRQCETGGNYQMHTWVGGREYAGASGTDVIYWRAQGHRPDPQYAPAWLQDQVELSNIAALGIRRSNPGCAIKLGLG